MSSDKMLLKVKTARCPQNHPCPSVRVCPVGALSQKGFKAPEVDDDSCIKCGKCVRFCPMGALALE
jgi:Dissimilatory sulfite reductase (desulfoviridin), alpha and beta subunits